MSRPFDKGAKKREIAAAAMAVFAEHGFEAASMRRVAEEAGIGKGTIYEYYRSKDELIADAIRLWMEGMITEAQEALEGLHDAEERLRAYVNGFVDMFLDDERLPALFLSIFQLFMTKLHDTNYGQALKDMFRGGVTAIETILMDGAADGTFRIEDRAEAERIAVNLMAYLDGICLDYVATGGSFDLREQVEHYMKYLLEADIK